MHENELMVWMLGSVVLAFLVMYRKDLRRLPASGLLFAAYLSVWLAWSATNLEHVFWYQPLNIVEHVGYALNGVLLLSWCWFAFRHGKPELHAHD